MLAVCIIATLNALNKVGLSRFEVLILGFLYSVNTPDKFVLKAERKVDSFCNQAIKINLELFSDVFQCKIGSATFYKTLGFDVRIT